MRAVVEVKFRDLKAGTVREAGEEIEVSRRRFAEINRKIPGCLDEIEEEADGDGKESR